MILPPNPLSALSDQIFELRAAGADIIRLDIGSPDLPPAPQIVDALMRAAMRSNAHSYQPHSGTASLRRAWATMYRRVFGVTVNAEDVLPLLGSKEGIFHLSQALLKPGDVALVPDPGYQTYAVGARFAGAEPVALPLLPENNYLPNLEAVPIEVAQRARLLWLNYPHNPTAALAPLDFFAQAVEFCRRHDILLCHDAAYTQVVFNGVRAPSVLEVDGAAEVAIEFNTLSKSHNMAGWRVGAVLGQTDAIKALLRLKTHADSGHFLPVMEAAVIALTGDQTWLVERNAIYARRHEALLVALKKNGLKPLPSQASLYLWCPLPGDWGSSSSFAQAVLEQAHVALAPGTVFGCGGEGFVRFSLVQSEARLVEAARRIGAFLSSKRAGASP